MDMSTSSWWTDDCETEEDYSTGRAARRAGGAMGRDAGALGCAQTGGLPGRIVALVRLCSVVVGPDLGSAAWIVLPYQPRGADHCPHI